MVTLALTVTVPLTVAPEAGEVTVTIRLPSCADASCGTIQLPTTIASRAAARAIPFFTAPRSRLRRRSVAGALIGGECHALHAHDLYCRQRVPGHAPGQRQQIDLCRREARGQSERCEGDKAHQNSRHAGASSYWCLGGVK